MGLTISCKIAKTFYNSIPVIYCRTGLLPKCPGYLRYVGVNYFLALILLPTAEAHGTFSFDRSYNGSWNPENSKTITLDNRTGVGLLACILYIF